MGHELARVFPDATGFITSGQQTDIKALIHLKGSTKAAAVMSSYYLAALLIQCAGEEGFSYRSNAPELITK